jgi:hypothetical protein
MNKVMSRKELEQAISTISKMGIRADKRHLIDNIRAQFSDYREWIREYVVNAADATATWCRISGEQDDDRITIYVDDNGHGMDEQGVKDFMTLFRSVKKGSPHKTVGMFGVGKASILAIPGLIGLTLESSTGSESWIMETGSLLEDSPVSLKQFEPVPPRGTRFRITFKIQDGLYLGQELDYLGDVLEKYVKYLPMNIIVEKKYADPQSKQFMTEVRSINSDWSDQNEYFSKRYSFSIKSMQCKAVLAIGNSTGELYQNNVLVTDRYNLLSHDIKPVSNHLHISHLRIRIDSPGFELPFGRHCLRNEHVLNDIAAYLRNKILPDYFTALAMYGSTKDIEETGVSIEQIETIACDLMKYNSAIHLPWSNLPVFRTTDNHRISLANLLRLQKKKGVLYIEDSSTHGADYSIFGAPVLGANQPPGAMAVLKNVFSDELVNLSFEDVIIEKPGSPSDHLGPDEKRFESYIGYHPNVSWASLTNSRRHSIGGTTTRPIENSDQANMELKSIFDGVSNASRSARKEMEEITWRLNYLVERDGKTPCKSHKFLFITKTVVLNLHHPAVQKLLKLSTAHPDLAGHWSLAMCISENSKILSHLSENSREELIKLDALARISAKERSISAKEQREENSARNVLGSYLKDLDIDFDI